jgi:hypothetical protein
MSAEELHMVFRAVALAAFADGEPSPVELKVVQKHLAEYPELAGLDVKQLVIEVYQQIKAHGAQAVLDDIVACLLDRKYQELAYKLASEVISADGRTASGEEHMLAALREAFGFSEGDILMLLS